MWVQGWSGGTGWENGNNLNNMCQQTWLEARPNTAARAGWRAIPACWLTLSCFGCFPLAFFKKSVVISRRAAVGAETQRVLGGAVDRRIRWPAALSGRRGERGIRSFHSKTARVFVASPRGPDYIVRSSSQSAQASQSQMRRTSSSSMTSFPMPVLWSLMVSLSSVSRIERKWLAKRAMK